MVPKTFCQSADGDYRKWQGGNVTPADLSRYSPDKDFVYVHGIVVYGFYFEADDGRGRKWNCKTGWQDGGML